MMIRKLISLKLVSQRLQKFYDVCTSDRFSAIRGLSSQHSFQQHAPPAFWELVSSIASAWKTDGPTLSLGELLWGTQALAAQHAVEPRRPGDRLQGEPVHDAKLLRHLAEAVDIAGAAYKKDKYYAAALCRLKVHDILYWHAESNYLAPGYYVALDHAAEEVVLVVRGTRRLSDLITDITTAHPYLQGATHWGMHQAALWLLAREAPRIRGLLRRFPSYRLHVLGHSMGGGVAALLAHMAHNDGGVAGMLLPEGAEGITDSQGRHKIYATCIATPCIMTRGQANSCRSYVTTLILGDDIAPRLNSTTAAQLRRDIAATDWKAHVAGLLNVQDYVDKYKQVTHGISGFQPLKLLPTTTSADADKGTALVRTDTNSTAGSYVADLTQRADLLLQETQARVTSMVQSAKDAVTCMQQSSAQVDPQPSDSQAPKVRSLNLNRLIAWVVASPAKTDETHQEPAASGTGNEIVLSAHDGSLRNHNDTTMLQSSKPGERFVVAHQEWGIEDQDDEFMATPVTGDLKQRASEADQDDLTDMSTLRISLQGNLQEASRKLRILQTTLPERARAALLRALSSPDSGNPNVLQRLLSDTIMKRSTASNGEALAHTNAQANAVTSSSTTSPLLQLHALACRPRTSVPDLYPAGQIYYLDKIQHYAEGRQNQMDTHAREITSSSGSPTRTNIDVSSSHAGGGLSHARQFQLLRVPPDAEFFTRVLLTRSAFQEHRSKAYRAALNNLLHREP